MINGDFIHESLPCYVCLLYFYIKLLHTTMQGHHMMVLVIRVEPNVAVLYHRRKHLKF